MFTSNFKVERSNLGIYLKTHTYKYSLLNFLDKHDMLKEKYKVLIAPYKNQKAPLLYVPVKLANKMPFILASTSCVQLNKCLYNIDSLKMIKKRAKNYYCEDLLKNLVSVFGNEKAKNEFEIESEWKPKFRFAKIDHRWSEIFVPYFSFMTYKECVHRVVTINGPFYVHKVKLVTGVYWSNNKEEFTFRPTSLNKFNNVSKIRISRTLNNPKKKDIRNFKEIIECVDINQNLLTKDGLELRKDLSLIRALVL